MHKRVILLNGPSGSGKSTLAHALRQCLQNLRNEDWPIFSIDDYLKMDPDRPIYEDDVYEINASLLKDAVAALQTAPGVIVDHVITSERIYLQCCSAFASAQLRSVLVTCPLNVLIARERARKDRCIGSAEASMTYLYPKDGYALSVDTGKATPCACADALYRQFFSEDTL